MQLFTQLLSNGLVVGAIYGLFAVGFALVFGVTRLFHLAYAAVYTIAAYAFFVVQEQLQLPFAGSLLAAIAVAVVVGLLCEVLVYRPLRRRGADTHLILVAALGIIIVVENMIVLTIGPASRVLVAGEVRRAFSVLGITLTTSHLIVIGTAIVIVTAAHLFTRRTPIGRQMTAVGDNPELAEVAGISVRRTFLAAFIAGSVVAAISAVVVGRSTGISPGMGFNPVLVGSVAVIVAGSGRVLPAFAAGVVMGVLENLAVLWLPSEYQPTVMFGALIIVLLARPYGLFGSRERSLIQSH